MALTPQERAQNLITQNRQNTGQRSANLPQTEANVRAKYLIYLRKQLIKL